MKLYDLNTILNFGKYKGETIENIIKKNSQYIGWCIRFSFKEHYFFI